MPGITDLGTYTGVQTMTIVVSGVTTTAPSKVGVMLGNYQRVATRVGISYNYTVAWNASRKISSPNASIDPNSYS